MKNQPETMFLLTGNVGKKKINLNSIARQDKRNAKKGNISLKIYKLEQPNIAKIFRANVEMKVSYVVNKVHG